MRTRCCTRSGMAVSWLLDIRVGADIASSSCTLSFLVLAERPVCAGRLFGMIISAGADADNSRSAYLGTRCEFLPPEYIIAVLFQMFGKAGNHEESLCNHNRMLCVGSRIRASRMRRFFIGQRRFQRVVGECRIGFWLLVVR